MWGKTVMAAQNFSGQPLAAGWLGNGSEDRESLDLLFSLTYAELRRLASSVKRGDLSPTLTPTALVNEAWIKMAKSGSIHSTSQLHFKRIAARAMRQLLVEASRRKRARKRGGEGEASFVVFDDALDGVSAPADLEALDTALEQLARLEPRQAAIVESRFFGGLENGEIAGLLGVSEATILRDWRAAKAWLGHELRRSR
jgi:RNA polymerase sigma factor (TIGR02999 family)